MKPNKAGLWEWVNDDGKTVVVDVCNCGTLNKPWLRVYYAGGYYNVHDEGVGTWEEEFCKAEWPDRWGNPIPRESFVGKIHNGLSEKGEII